MPKSSSATVTLDVDAESQPRRLAPESDKPFRILLLGDFTGRANRGEPPPERLKPQLIDRDNFDDVLARLRPELRIGRSEILRFHELDDFHPDRVYRQEVFAKLRAVRNWITKRPQATGAAARPAPPPDISAMTGGSLLDSVLETTETGPSEAPRRLDPLQQFVERTVAPHTLPRNDPRLAEKDAILAEEAAKIMRALLHFPEFQWLEAAWRALDWLVRGLETGPQLKIYLLDIDEAALPAKLDELRRILVDEAARTPGAETWAVVGANYTFSRTKEDIRLLTALAAIARAAGAVLLSEADPNEADSAESERLWQAFRHSPDASSVGLALPRFLLRLPYGEKTSTLESFPFEEMPDAPEHNTYLWGNPAFFCAYLLGREFESDGWDMRPGRHNLVTGLPLHLYQADGEQRLKPCAELLLTDSAAESLLDEGFMPLVSIKDQDAVRLLRFQSIADPPAPLDGAWA